MLNLDDFRNAAAKLAAKTSKIAAELQAKERADIAGAVAEKSHLVDGYWKKRRDAEQRALAARKLCDALDGIEDDEKLEKDDEQGTRQDP